MRLRFWKAALALAATAALGTASAATVDFSFQGSFAADNDVQLFTFTTDGTSTVRLITYSYAGGTQANGATVAAGGFDPILALFDATGLLIGQNDDAGSGSVGACGSAAVNADPVTGQHYDTCLDLALAAGSYTVSVAQYANFAVGPNLAAGFSETSPNFTQTYGCSNGQFCDVARTNRTSAWAFDILNVLDADQTDNDVPEPGSLALAAVALLGAGAVKRRRRAG